MAEDATDADAARRDGHPLYRVAPGGQEPHDWVVVTGTPDDPGPAVLYGFKTEKAAQEAANTLSSLESDNKRADEVLQRMLNAGPGHGGSC